MTQTKDQHMSHPDPVLTFAFEARVSVAPSERIGHGVGEELWFTPITGGTIDGPRLQVRIHGCVERRHVCDQIGRSWWSSSSRSGGGSSP